MIFLLSQLAEEQKNYLIGLGADMEGDSGEPVTEPLFTVTFVMLNEEPIHLSFYAYNANFYTVWREGVEFEYITNKQNVDTFFEGAAALLANPGL